MPQKFATKDGFRGGQERVEKSRLLWDWLMMGGSKCLGVAIFMSLWIVRLLKEKFLLERSFVSFDFLFIRLQVNLHRSFGDNKFFLTEVVLSQL